MSAPSYRVEVPTAQDDPSSAPWVVLLSDLGRAEAEAAADRDRGPAVVLGPTGAVVYFNRSALELVR